MKLPKKAIKAASYVSGIFAIASAGLLVFLLLLAIIGLIHPRTTSIILYTEDVSKIYDGTPLSGSEPQLYGSPLHDGHKLVIRELPEITLVGEARNAPVYRISDDTGADVTDQYDITEKFGSLTVSPRPITLRTSNKTMRYNGQPLSGDQPSLVLGDLVTGHTLVFEEANELVDPGTLKNQCDYRIEDENGINRADQYEITEKFGELSVLPIVLCLRTDSASKHYDGEPLSDDGWVLASGTLLENHSLSAETVSVIQEVGSCNNEIRATVTDANGTDMTHLYEFTVFHGTLNILPLPLIITTGSAEKVYDGTPLSCDEWSLTSGELEPGASVIVAAPYIHDGIGIAQNEITFRILDRNGKDISDRYSIQGVYGTLNIQPRPLTILTGSAEKVYDGNVLTCNDYTILSGALCPNDHVYLDCVSYWGVGYSENLVLSCVIMREENGIQTDVTNHYRIAFQYGILRITAN